MELELPFAPSQPVSALAFNTVEPTSEQLLVASWDNAVRLYDIKGAKTSEEVRLLHTIAHEAPVLDTCWINGRTAASASVDRRIRILDLEKGTSVIIGKHDMPVSKICFNQESGLLVSGSWDRTLKVWHPQSRRLLQTLSLDEKILTMDVTRPAPSLTPEADATPRLVVGLTNRKVVIYNLTRWAIAASRAVSGEDTSEEDWAPEDSRESSLKFMFRDVQCMPNGTGFAMSSVEGRVSVDFFDPAIEVQSKKYAFKCHRQPSEEGIDTVYPINALAFHPTLGTFVTLGGDSVVNVWDPVAKRRIRMFPKYAASLSAASFSADGRWLAVAVGAEGVEDEGKGDLESAKVISGPVSIMVRRIGDEMKPKSSKSKK
ncbi:mitotic spindle checkpoint protein Bub3 [Tilletia horrida]|nr:mitotic spindle checkpoint protein Bub3 [Tilletia horrida]KAK0564206.1 mitotic spindle checkpoint protein Bub3 [Tilletia horrida]